MSGRPVLAASSIANVLFPEPASPVTTIRRPSSADAPPALIGTHERILARLDAGLVLAAVPFRAAAAGAEGALLLAAAFAFGGLILGRDFVEIEECGERSRGQATENQPAREAVEADVVHGRPCTAIWHALSVARRGCVAFRLIASWQRLHLLSIAVACGGGGDRSTLPSLLSLSPPPT